MPVKFDSQARYGIWGWADNVTPEQLRRELYKIIPVGLRRKVRITKMPWDKIKNNMSLSSYIKNFGRDQIGCIYRAG